MRAAASSANGTPTRERAAPGTPCQSSLPGIRATPGAGESVLDIDPRGAFASAIKPKGQMRSSRACGLLASGPGECPMDLQLHDKTALVTGSTLGSGSPSPRRSHGKAPESC